MSALFRLVRALVVFGFAVASLADVSAQQAAVQPQFEIEARLRLANGGTMVIGSSVRGRDVVIFITPRIIA